MSSRGNREGRSAAWDRQAQIRNSLAPFLRPPSATAVGNLPFDATEQQLQEILATAGPIKHFRWAPPVAAAAAAARSLHSLHSLLCCTCPQQPPTTLPSLLLPPHATHNNRMVNDRDTGRPKGFGFCEFYDVATAESAHRNLNGYEIGGRTMRIDFAEDFQTRGRGGWLVDCMGACVGCSCGCMGGAWGQRWCHSSSRRTHMQQRCMLLILLLALPLCTGRRRRR